MVPAVDHKRRTGRRIVGGDLVGAAQQELILARHGRDDGRREGDHRRPRRAPKLAAALAIQGHQKTFAVELAGDDHRIAIDQRGGSIAVFKRPRTERAGRLLPQRLALEVQRHDLHLVVMVERGEQPLAVAGDGRRRLRVLAVVLGRKRAAADLGLPERPARGAIEGQHVLDLLPFIGRGQKHAVADDGRATNARAPARASSIRTFCCSPSFVGTGVFGGHAVARRTAPPGPIGVGVQLGKIGQGLLLSGGR